jgi:iron-sulfur cluster insertion protein
MSQAPPQELSSVNITTPKSVTLTDAAAAKIAELIHEEEDPSLMFRAYIKGGGCSGFEYHFAFEEEKKDSDTEIKKKGKLESGEFLEVTLLIDRVSLPYLLGAIVDYKQDIEGERFIITNPNAKTTCGCGSSFSVE